MNIEKVYQMEFGKIYPLLVNKATKKGRRQDEVNTVITWLTGYKTQDIESAVEQSISYGEFFRNAPKPNLRSSCRRDSRASHARNSLSGQIS